jgi:hypothetical protein
MRDWLYKAVFFLVLLLSSMQNVYSQAFCKSTYTLTPRIHYGAIIRTSKEVAHLADQHVPAFELDLNKQTKGNLGWQQEYHYPQVGYSLMYFRFDPQKPIGNALALFIHAGKSFYKAHRTNFQWRIGFGLAYVEKRFQVQHNFRNDVISQKINFTINGQLNYNIMLSRNVMFNFGIGLFHISNGALKRPNFGINIPTAHAGIGINIIKGEDEYRRDRDSVGRIKRTTHLHVGSFMGLKEVYPVNGPKYFLGGLNAVVERRLNHKSGINIGIDLSYDHSKKSEIVYDSVDISNTFIHRAQAGVIAGHELYLHRLSLLTQMGVYLYDPSHLDRRIYQKVGFKYYLTKRFYVNMTLKLNLGVADWIEWGGGFRL